MSASEVLGDEPCSRGSVMVLDSFHAPGCFLVTLLLKHALKNGDKVVLLAVDQAPSHYKQVLRKLGVDMDKLVEAEQLVLISCLSGGAEHEDIPSTGLCQAVYAKVAAAIEQLSSAAGERRLSLFVDDLSILAALSGRFRGDVAKLIDSSRGLCCSLEMEFRFVCLAHRNVELDGQWIGLLKETADAVVAVESLGSVSDDIHGQVAMTHNRVWAPGQDMHCSFYYRLVEGGVRFWTAVAL
mmetsp:Transcript_19721/g.54771  ORF Transcript_19721/g.54771 Transcript_19721/m.54771 type:complete len:240 (+) Transcript_19721:110-829(+)